MSKPYPKYAKYSKAKGKQKQSLYERFLIFIQNSKRIIKVASKPSRKEYFTVFKICAIGIAVLGVLSYVIQLIFSVAIPLGE